MENNEVEKRGRIQVISFSLCSKLTLLSKVVGDHVTRSCFPTDSQNCFIQEMTAKANRRLSEGIVFFKWAEMSSLPLGSFFQKDLGL